MASDASHIHAMSNSDSSATRAVLPTLRQLQFLTALHAHGGFVRAAEAIGVTQPTLSSGIKELEATLGVTLVDRSRPGAVLTAAGEEAADRAAAALSAVEALVQAMRGADAPLTGRFVLGAIPTIAPFLLPRALPLLRQKFPALQLILKEDQTARLLEQVRARSIDAAILALPYEAGGIETASIGEDEFLLAAPDGHPLLARIGLTPEDVDSGELLLLEDGHCLRDHALKVCRFASGRANAAYAATSLHTLLQMVGGDMGVTLAPRLATEGGAAAGAAVRLRSFAPPVIGRTIGIAWRAGGPRRADALMLAEALAALMPGAGD
jgi:LysR family transcriptional regulator, hydrogen peroxide-inducible genes activator